MRIWIHRTKQSPIPEEDIHMVERHPEIVTDYTKLYVLYDDPGPVPGHIDGCRKGEIPSYWYPEIQPGETVAFNSTPAQA